jgi:hypothetical protein
MVTTSKHDSVASDTATIDTFHTATTINTFYTAASKQKTNSNSDDHIMEREMM